MHGVQRDVALGNGASMVSLPLHALHVTLCTCSSIHLDVCAHYPGPVFLGSPGGIDPFASDSESSSEINSDPDSNVSYVEVDAPTFETGLCLAPPTLSVFDHAPATSVCTCASHATDVCTHYPGPNFLGDPGGTFYYVDSAISSSESDFESMDLEPIRRKRRRPTDDTDDSRPTNRRRRALTCDPPPGCEPGSPPLVSQGGGNGDSSISRAHPADYRPP
jgi:hypothetical protein